MFVTARTEEQDDALGEITEALRAIEVPVESRPGGLIVDGEALRVEPYVRAHPTPAELSDLMTATAADTATRPDEHDAPVRAIVADRISEAGRERLRDGGWSWLDRRGSLRLWAPGIRIESAIPATTGRPNPNHGNPWTVVGLETALAALIRPDTPVTARRVAPFIGRSVGAVQDAIGRFGEVGLVGAQSRLPLLPDLFWETAAHWPDGDWLSLPVEIDTVAEAVGPDQLVRVDERVATLAGARIPSVGSFPARCYTVSAAALRRARRLLGDANAPTRCWVRPAPVRWIPEYQEVRPTPERPWRLAHPLLCALRIAADPARGQEIVQEWGIVPETAQP
jgi:hypothetical protein